MLLMVTRLVSGRCAGLLRARWDTGSRRLWSKKNAASVVGRSMGTKHHVGALPSCI